MGRWGLAVLIGTVAAAQPDGRVPEAVMRLARIRRVAAEIIRNQPNFTCLETIRRERAAGRNARLLPVDVVRVEVAHTGERELFAWPGQEFRFQHLNQMLGVAMTSDGDFALHAKAIFTNSQTQITYRGEEDLAGRPAYAYDFRIPIQWSGWSVGVGGAHATVGYSGTFWIDRRSLRMLRTEFHGEDFPLGLPVVSVETRIDLGMVQIGEAQAWLPQVSETSMTLIDGEQARNVMEFTHCRAYGAESALSFAPENEAPKDSPRELTLPVGLTVPVRLLTAVTSKNSHEGDPIEAEVDADVRWKSQVVLPKGARLRGRVRRLESYAKPLPHFIVSLEFITVENAGARGAFYGQLQTARKTDSKLPGVGTFLLDGAEFSLPAGMPMTWRTVQVGR